MEQVNQTAIKSKKIKLDFKDSKYATGRRKRSIAKVWVKKGSGNIHVNGLKMNEYFIFIIIVLISASYIKIISIIFRFFTVN